MGTARAAARMRAAPSRSSARPTARPTARPAGARGSSHAPATAAAGRGQAPATSADETGPLDAVLELQQSAGNRAVVQLLASGSAAALPPSAGFGAGNRAFTAALARPATAPVRVLQREMAVDADPKLRVEMLRDAIRFEPLLYRFVIDAGKTTEALSNMTAEDGRTVKTQFKAQKGWNLGWIFSAVEQPIEDGPPATNNLSGADRTRMLNLLGGTAIKPAAPTPAPLPGPAPEPSPATTAGAEAAPATGGGAPAPPAPVPDADAARVTQNRLRVTVASIRAAVQKKDAKTAIGLIPASMDERREVDKLYDAMYGQTAYMALFTKLPGKHGQRAAAIWYDEKDDADRLAIEAATDERDKAETEATALESSGMEILANEGKRRRKEGKDKVEAEVKRVASAGDQSTLAGRAASRDRLKKVLDTGGPKGTLAKRVGADSDPVIRAIAQGDEADEIGARLARADATTDVAAAQVEAAIREVRSLAEEQADLAIDLAPDVLDKVRPFLTKAIIDGYFGRFKEAFDNTQTRRPFEAMIAGRAGTEERAAKAIGLEVGDVRDMLGQTSDINRNKVLLARGGELEEWGELFFALTKKPKDIERVRQILGSKTYTEVKALAEVYATRSGRSLEADLAGTEVEQAMAGYFKGEAREDLQERRSLLAGGAWDREVAEKTVPRDADAPTREAHLLAAEGDFLFKRLAGLERRVLENRGLFAEARDWSGNEEKRILDQVRKDMWTAKAALGNALTPDRGTTWTEGEEGTPLAPDLGAARRAVSELRRIDRRLTHAVTIYKESTKKAYEEFVDLVVNAATIAAGLGVTGIWITALRTTAATVGTKLLMKGSDYTVDEFLGDIQGGMAGVAGDFAKLGFKQFVAPYVARKILRYAKRVGMSKEFIEKVRTQVGDVAMRQAEHTIGTGVSNVAQGRDVTEGQGLGERVKGEAIGAVTAPIDQKIKDRKAAAAATKPGAGDEPAQAGPVRQADEVGAAARPAGAEGREDGEPRAGGAKAAGEPESAGPPAEAPDVEPAPIVSMALEAPAPRPRATGAGAGASGQAPPTEARPPRRPAAGAIDGPGHMDAPRTDGAETARPGKAAPPTTKQPPVEGRPRAMTVKDDGGTAPKALEYPAGAVQLNAPGGPTPPAVGPHPAGQDLDAQPRSDGVRRQANQRLREAEERMKMVNELGMTSGPMHGDALASLREAQAYYDVTHGKRPPTLDELRRVADDEVAEAEVHYALAKDSDTWKAREKAEREHAAAVEEHRRAKSSAAAAHAWVLNLQNRDTDAGTLQASYDAFDAANARLKAAQQAVGPASARRDRAAAADWTSRRAWTALRLARELQGRAAGRPTPPPPPGARTGGGPVHGPAAPLEEGPGPRRFTPELWDQEMVIQLKNATSLKEHEALVFKMLQEDPTREIGLFRNSKTGEWIVVRGKQMTVVVESAPGSGNVTGGSGPRGEGQRQRWKELLAKGGDVGEWDLIAHSHPTERGQLVNRIAQYPSAYKGDFSVLRSEAERDGKPKSSTIYYMDGNIRQKTTFGYDPSKVEPYWLQMPGEPVLRFQTLRDYHRYLEGALAPYGVQPELEPIPAGHQEVIGSDEWE